MNCYFKKSFIALTLILSMISAFFQGIVSKANVSIRKNTADCRILVEKTTDILGNESFEIKLINNTIFTLDNWAIEFYSDSRIEKIENATIASQKDGTITVVGNEYNDFIESYGETAFSFSVAKTDSEYPKDFRFFADKSDPRSKKTSKGNKLVSSFPIIKTNCINSHSS